MYKTKEEYQEWLKRGNKIFHTLTGKEVDQVQYSSLETAIVRFKNNGNAYNVLPIHLELVPKAVKAKTKKGGAK